MKLSNQIKTQTQSQAGFTFIEVMIAITIFSVGVLGLMTSTHTVSHGQRNSDFMTEATLIATDRMEEIKRVATNEPSGGAFGFDHFVDDNAGGFLNVANWTDVDDFTREIIEDNQDDSKIPPGFDRRTIVQVYPVAAQATEDFDNPETIHMVEVIVEVSWDSTTGKQRNLQLNTVLQRRQFIQ